jgi:transglutaminase-like putative cysteine protease
VSNASTSAFETARKRKGVCRDFAHLGISLCRVLRIPARMVVGYLHLLDPMDLHAWFEAFIGRRWYTFDATAKNPRGNRILIGYGRDAADVAQLSEYGQIKTAAMSIWSNLLCCKQSPQGSSSPALVVSLRACCFSSSRPRLVDCR